MYKIFKYFKYNIKENKMLLLMKLLKTKREKKEKFLSQKRNSQNKNTYLFLFNLQFLLMQ